jgi:cytochrome c oxidase assembly protein subunit 15
MTTSVRPFADLPPNRRLIVGWWLALWAFMVLLTVVIGGVTRLTESGLSITEWAPVTGVLPPLTEDAWQEAFRGYQQIPEYQQLNRGMTLSEFKSIYFWEYVHRVWARLVGLVLAAPLIFFLVRRWLSRPLTVRLVTLLVLTGAQGVLGWFMVASGLADRTDVSPYRLAAHLGLALVIYVVTVWTAADLLSNDEGVRQQTAQSVRPLRRLAGMLAGLVFATAIAGAFVAGLDGGRAYNTIPLMGGQFVPGGYLALAPWWRNLFENVAAVQFNHRWIGVLTLIAMAVVWYRGRGSPLSPQARRWLNLLPLIALGQVTLGVATLLLFVPVWLAALHQAGAVILLTASLLLYHTLVRGRLAVTADQPSVSELAVAR